ncbi:hypothetical protein CCICO_10215 [Corynebacterium ciconiae DSM 44920]|uniref:GAP1-N2 domain-containing protein n=1 Tax=Corynebacterium ciconiae TaxID=227319 RepID=UPI0003806B1E|nr:hypothetical protein [Corynebacterium ciconiae]WKD62042.1 hypothetical protein CCICO_10215 [Corynebacterium ciconiae DSM 44920]
MSAPLSQQVLGTFSFASFGRSATRAGGWGVGATTGRITQQLIQKLRPTIPSALVDGIRYRNYPSSAEIAHLNRRFAWLPVIDDTGAEVWAFYASCHAGQDSSGRPGNVFTFVQVHDSGEQTDPIRMMYSPQIPVPFGKREVDAASLPAELTEPGPVDESVLQRFIAEEPEGSLPVPWENLAPSTSGGPRREYVDAAVAVLRDTTPVVVACPLEEAPLWVAAIYRALGERIGFSTFHNPERLSDILGSAAQLVAVRADHVQAARDNAPAPAVVLDVTAPLPEELRALSDSRPETRDETSGAAGSAAGGESIAEQRGAQRMAIPETRFAEAPAAERGMRPPRTESTPADQTQEYRSPFTAAPPLSEPPLPHENEWSAPTTASPRGDYEDDPESDEEFLAALSQEPAAQTTSRPATPGQLRPGEAHTSAFVVTEDDLRHARMPLVAFVELMTQWFNVEHPAEAAANTRIAIRMNRLAAVEPVTDDILRLRARIALVALINDVHACDSPGQLLDLDRHELDRLHTFLAKEVDDLLVHREPVEKMLYRDPLRPPFRSIEEAVDKLKGEAENREIVRCVGPQLHRLLRG